MESVPISPCSRGGGGEVAGSAMEVAGWEAAAVEEVRGGCGGGGRVGGGRRRLPAVEAAAGAVEAAAGAVEAAGLRGGGGDEIGQPDGVSSEDGRRDLVEITKKKKELPRAVARPGAIYSGAICPGS